MLSYVNCLNLTVKLVLSTNYLTKCNFIIVGENLYDNLNSPTFDEPMGGEHEDVPEISQDPEERERQLQEWKDELVKVSGDQLLCHIETHIYLYSRIHILIL